MTEDEKLLQLFRMRDESALQKVSERFGRLCSTMACRILGSREEAEECTNDMLMKLWDSIPPNEPRCMAAYVSRITRNLCLDRYAKLHAEKRGGSQIPAVIEELSPYLPAEGTPEDLLESIAVREALTRFLRSLSDDARRIFLARYYSFQTVAEIAKEHGTTEGRVKMILKRSRDRLRKQLAEEELL